MPNETASPSRQPHPQAQPIPRVGIAQRVQLRGRSPQRSVSPVLPRPGVGLDQPHRVRGQPQDGVHWNRMRSPVLEPVDGTDSRGLEDPRVVEIGGLFYVTYTAYGREFHGRGLLVRQPGGGRHGLRLLRRRRPRHRAGDLSAGRTARLCAQC